MKKSVNFLLVIIAFLISNSSYSQILKFSDIGLDKPEGKFKEYITKDGISFKVGDTIVIGKGTGENGLFVHLLNAGQRLSASFSGYKSVIENFYFEGNKKVGWKIRAFTNKLTFMGAPILFYPEDIACTGELIGYGISSDDALKELRRSKEKLDLELITREEYDKIKAELSKYIK
jgi:hypothetical protein